MVPYFAVTARHPTTGRVDQRLTRLSPGRQGGSQWPYADVGKPANPRVTDPHQGRGVVLCRSKPPIEMPHPRLLIAALVLSRSSDG